jgi:hypothetical protein
MEVNESILFACSIKHTTSFSICIVGGGVQLGPLGTAATIRPIVSAPGDYDNEEIDGMIGKGNRNTRRKPAPVPSALSSFIMC